MIEHIEINEFNQIYEIMEKSFPLTEFRPREKQAELFKNKNYRVLGIKENEKIISIAAIWQFENFTFIEHLATVPEKRNCGLGAKILQSIIDGSKNPVCLEVEPPEDDLTRRRVAFYERNGMFFNSYPYIQPSISEGRAPIPLFIMTSKSQIDENTFNKIKSTLYTQVYGIKAID